MHEAENQLSQLAERARKGERIVISCEGQPWVDLVPHQHNTTPRQPGGYRGRIVIDEAFDEADSDIQSLFEGDS
ncbi:hypothetical protein CF392_00835 [Tamilnaduibacter salinus]|uniref:Type II toxin-antitoxin system prevent-host-death family antitoxin n=1 Tax=Tamilnaduibacter salinus TaxID=1484056 RepID=A0A2A2I6N6_9GAMM|nr:hypothetical protein CF392_00835 [Tamilnaduibacter salinus]